MLFCIVVGCKCRCWEPDGVLGPFAEEEARAILFALQKKYGDEKPFSMKPLKGAEIVVSFL